LPGKGYKDGQFCLVFDKAIGLLLEVSFMTLTKADLVNHIYEKNKLRKAEAVLAMEALLEIIKTSLANNESVLISGFGKFNVKNKKERRGRNPQTGAELMLSPRRVVTFKPSSILRQRINNKKI
jgi:integration host factor subunit alpha